MATKTAPTLIDIEAARGRILGHARTTPVYGSDTLSRRAGRRVWLKAENLQRTGSFKVRGALNRLAELTDEERGRGVITISAGNHAQAVAWAAREAGLEPLADQCMPYFTQLHRYRLTPSQRGAALPGLRSEERATREGGA